MSCAPHWDTCPLASAAGPHESSALRPSVKLFKAVKFSEVLGLRTSRLTLTAMVLRQLVVAVPAKLSGSAL